MPTKSKIYKADEYESASDIENTDTLIGRNQAPKLPKKKVRPDPDKKKKVKKAQKTRRPVTPNSGRPHSGRPNSGRHNFRQRSNSAPPIKSGRELWLHAVKSRETVGLYSPRKLESPRHKTPTEYFVETLRKTGVGISTESGLNSMSNLKRPLGDKEMAYLSTSSYLRQKTGMEKPRKYDNPTTKPPSGTPAYKSPEEYYDQILELKKQIQALNHDNATLKAKVRRTEEDNIKKEKEIGGLLDPTKSDELRRTLGDKRTESGSVIHSMKQKILKLETQLKDKESSYTKLQGDLKATKIEEMKVQLDACFQEILRLQVSKDSNVHTSNRTGRESNVKAKALNETVLRLNKQNEQLQSEIRTLREDLQREMDEKGKDTSREYEDMNRKQLLNAVKRLEKKLHSTERKMGDTDSIQSYDVKMDDRQAKHKITTEGSVENRLDQLDKRETQLLAEIDKQKELIKKLQDDKATYRKKCEDKEKEIQALQKELNELQSRLNMPLTGRRTPPTPGRQSRPPSGRKTSIGSTTSEDKLEAFKKDKAARKIQNQYKAHRRARDDYEDAELDEQVDKFRKNKAAKNIQQHWRKHREHVEDQETERQVEQFRRNHAARNIQKKWTNYQYRKQEKESDDAALFIQSAYRGHMSRKSHMKSRYSDDDEDYDDEDEDEDYKEAVDFIRNSVRGHASRKKKLKTMHIDSPDEEIEDYYRTKRPPSIKASTHSRFGARPGSAGRPSSSGSANMRPGSGRSRTSSGGRRSPANYRTFDDDDDDIEC